MTAYSGQVPQRTMSERAGSTVVEAGGSHAIYVAHPATVAGLIEQATSGTVACGRPDEERPLPIS